MFPRFRRDLTLGLRNENLPKDILDSKNFYVSSLFIDPARENLRYLNSLCIAFPRYSTRSHARIKERERYLRLFKNFYVSSPAISHRSSSINTLLARARRVSDISILSASCSLDIRSTRSHDRIKELRIDRKKISSLNNFYQFFSLVKHAISHRFRPINPMVGFEHGSQYQNSPSRNIPRYPRGTEIG